MNYHYQKVDPRLTAYVRSVLVLGNTSEAERSHLPLFTAGMPALLCKITQDSHLVTVYGTAVPDEQWKLGNDSSLVVYFFKPFTLGTIFKLSAKQLKESPVELNCWNAQKMMALSLQLFYACTVAEKAEVLNHFIYTQIQANQRDCHIIQYVTDQLMQNADAEALSGIPAALNLTERTFQRIFKKYVGITATEYRRICQFYFAFSQLKSNHFEKHTDIAYTNGYFDQSHYIRSFKEFTDTTPNDYLQYGLKKNQ